MMLTSEQILMAIFYLLCVDNLLFVFMRWFDRRKGY